MIPLKWLPLCSIFPTIISTEGSLSLYQTRNKNIFHNQVNVFSKLFSVTTTLLKLSNHYIDIENVEKVLPLIWFRIIYHFSTYNYWWFNDSAHQSIMFIHLQSKINFPTYLKNSFVLHTMLLMVC